MLRTVFEQPDAESVHTQHRHVLEVLEAKYPAAAAHLDEARDDILAFTAFPKAVWCQTWSNNPKSVRTRRSAIGPMSWASSPTGRRSCGRPRAPVAGAMLLLAVAAARSTSGRSVITHL